MRTKALMFMLMTLFMIVPVVAFVQYGPSGNEIDPQNGYYNGVNLSFHTPNSTCPSSFDSVLKGGGGSTVDRLIVFNNSGTKVIDTTSLTGNFFNVNYNFTSNSPYYFLFGKNGGGVFYSNLTPVGTYNGAKINYGCFDITFGVYTSNVPSWPLESYVYTRNRDFAGINFSDTPVVLNNITIINIFPANYTVYGNPIINMAVNASGSNISNTSFYVYNSTGGLYNQTNLNMAFGGELKSTNVTLASTTANYTFKWIVFDTLGYNKSSATHNLNISLPQILNITPDNNTIFYSNTVNISVNATGYNLTNTTINVYNSTGGLYNSTSIDFGGKDKLSDNITLNRPGIYYYNWTIFNTFDYNISSQTYTFNSSFLNIIGISPPNNTINSTTSAYNISVNVSASNLSNATLYVYNNTGGLYNQTFIGSIIDGFISTIVTFIQGVYSWFWEVTNIFDEIVTTDNYTLRISTALSNINTHSKTNQSIMINWTTAEIANGTVDYGTTVGLGTKANNASFETFRTVALSGLINNTFYYYNVTSCDAFSNCQTNGTFNFTTLQNIDNNCVDLGNTWYCTGTIPDTTLNVNKNLTFVGVYANGINALSYTTSENFWIYNSTIASAGAAGDAGADRSDGSACGDTVTAWNGHIGQNGDLTLTATNYLVADNTNLTSTGGQGGQGGAASCTCSTEYYECTANGGDSGGGGAATLTINSAYYNFTNVNITILGGDGIIGGAAESTCNNAPGQTCESYGGNGGNGNYEKITISSTNNYLYKNGLIKAIVGGGGAGGAGRCNGGCGTVENGAAGVGGTPNENKIVSNRVEINSVNTSYYGGYNRFNVYDSFKINNSILNSNSFSNSRTINYSKVGNLLLDVKSLSADQTYNVYCPAGSLLIVTNDSTINRVVLSGCTNILSGYNINITPEQPANYSVVNTSDVNFTIHIIANDSVPLENATLRVYNSTGTLVNETKWSLTGLFDTVVSTVINLIDGVYTWVIESLDSVGTTSNVTQHVTVDTATPAIAFTPVTDAAGYINNRSEIITNITVYETNINYTLIRIYNNGGLYNSSLNTTYFNFSGLADNYYWINASVYDALGNSNSTETRQIVIDTIAPLLSVTNPPFNEAILSNTTFTAFSTDSTSGVNRVEFVANDKSTGLRYNDTVFGAGGWFETTLTIPDGSYNITVWSYDNASNNVSSGNINFLLDNVPPMIKFTSVTFANNSAYNRTDIIVNVSSSDAVSLNTTQIMIYYYNATVNETVPYFTITNTTGNDTLYANATAVFVPGMYLFNATANDTAGRSNATETRYIVLDNISSTISLYQNTPSNGSTFNKTAVNFSINIDGNNAPLGNATLYIYNSTGNLTNETFWDLRGIFSTTLNTIIDLIDGSYTWFIKVFDFIGFEQNQSTYIPLGTEGEDINMVERNFSVFSRVGAILFTPITDNTTFVNRNNIITNISYEKEINYSEINLYNSTGDLYNTSNITYFNFSGLPQGLYFFNASIFAYSGETNFTETRNTTVDSIPPMIKFNAPTTSAGMYNRSEIIANISFSDTNLNFTIINLYNVTGGVRINITDYENFSNIPDGRYNLNASAYDNASNYNSTETRYITLDNHPPEINMVYTGNGTAGQNWIDVNVTMNDYIENGSVFIWLLDQSYVILNTQVNASSEFFYNFTGLTDGYYYVTSAVNDSLGLSNHSESGLILIHAHAAAIEPMFPANRTMSTNLTWNISMNFSSSINQTNATLHIWNQTEEINATVFNLTGQNQGTISTIFNFFSGVFTWFFDIFDVIGNYNVTPTYNLVLDNTTPAFTTNFTEEQAFLRGVNITAWVNFTSPGSLNRYNISVDGMKTIVYNTNVNATNVQYNISWNSTNVADNNHTLTITVWNVGQSYNKTYNFSVQTIPNIIALLPANNTQVNMSSLSANFTATFNTSWYNTSCILLVNDVNTGAGTGFLYNINSQNASYRIPNVLLTEGQVDYNMTCSNNVGSMTSLTQYFWIDSSKPNVNGTTFVSGGMFGVIGRNLTGIWNLTDNLMLYSYNFSIRGKQIAYNNTINSNNITINLIIPLVNYTVGVEHLFLTIYDGHTAYQLLNNYTIDYGELFNDGLGFDIVEYGTDVERSMRIKSSSASMGDEWVVEKQIDRYSYEYVPKNTKQSSYEFIVTSTKEMSILTGELYQSWLVSGNNWMDFIIENQPNEKISIEKIDDYTAKVKITGLNFSGKVNEQQCKQVIVDAKNIAGKENCDKITGNNKNKDKFSCNVCETVTTGKKIKFHSLGELNTATYNYSFSVYNVTVLDSPSIASNTKYHALVTFNKGNATFGIMNISRAYNDTNLNLSYGVIVYNHTVTPHQEVWNISYGVPSIGGEVAVNYTVNYRWFITSTEQTLNLSQTITPLNIGDCSNASWTKAINLLLIDENSSNTTKLINGTVNIWLQVVPVGAPPGVTGANMSIKFEGANNYSICIVPNASVAVGNSIIEYMAPGYTIRHYFMINQTLTNATTVIKLYLIETALSTNIQAKVYDRTSGDPVPAAYIELLRYYPELNQYHLVEMMKSDSNGYGTFTLVPYNTLYKWIVIYDYEVKLDSDTSTVFTGTKLLPISLSYDVLREFQYIGAVAGNVTWDKPTQTAIFQWYDTNAVVQKGMLKVYRQNGWGQTLLSNTQLETAAGILTYTITENMTGSTYIAVGVLDPQLNWMQEAIWPYGTDIRGTWGDTVVFALMLLVIASAFMFLDLGVAGVVVGSMVALGFGSFMGIISLPIMILISLCIIGGIFIARANKTQ